MMMPLWHNSPWPGSILLWYVGTCYTLYICWITFCIVLKPYNSVVETECYNAACKVIITETSTCTVCCTCISKWHLTIFHCYFYMYIFSNCIDLLYLCCHESLKPLPLHTVYCCAAAEACADLKIENPILLLQAEWNMSKAFAGV